MKNRPVAAVGEVTAKNQIAKEALPEDSLGGVQPPAPEPPAPKRPVLDRTTRIQVPHKKEAGARLSRSRLFVILGLTAVAITTAVVVGVVIWSHQKKKKQQKELKRKVQRLKLRHILNRRGATRFPPGQCAKNMAWIATNGPTKGFCIDVYEFPNAKGIHPTNVADPKKAQKLCAGVGKRLCKKEEWQQACRGPKGWLYPYGATYQPSKCVTKPLKRDAPPVQTSGSWEDCRTPSGLFDMSGNMAEWVSGGALMGGSGRLNGKATSCHAEGGGGGPAYYGTRCCTSPLGSP